MERRNKPSKTFQEFAVAIKKLFDKAYRSAQEEQLHPYFIEGIKNVELQKELLRKKYDCAHRDESENVCLEAKSPRGQSEALKNEIHELKSELCKLSLKGNVQCFNCQRYRHKANQCFYQNRPRFTLKDNRRKFQGYITARMQYNNRPVNALVNTGSSASMIRYDIIKSGGMRLCIDYRMLNSVITADVHPIPRIDETLDHLQGAKWFSTLDLASGLCADPDSGG
ncbi:hypothetical protein RF11_02731 [Thelohanellus kitauei]|uniref:Uncharacterized protein n=1 Tax=Thelohanellus kitauei TaxID=669202 RepID=A0A0C2MDT5_THEKT|nr:hypothetical protein RF11_02731 [Thelohanellus kitauei]